MMRRRLICMAVLGASLGFGLTPQGVLADVWLCLLPNGTTLYSDRGGGPDCRLVKKDLVTKDKDVVKESSTPVMRGLHPAPVASQAPASTGAPRPDVQI